MTVLIQLRYLILLSLSTLHCSSLFPSFSVWWLLHLEIVFSNKAHWKIMAASCRQGAVWIIKNKRRFSIIWLANEFGISFSIPVGWPLSCLAGCSCMVRLFANNRRFDWGKSCSRTTLFNGGEVRSSILPFLVLVYSNFSMPCFDQSPSINNELVPYHSFTGQTLNFWDPTISIFLRLFQYLLR